MTTPSKSDEQGTPHLPDSVRRYSPEGGPLTRYSKSLMSSERPLYYNVPEGCYRDDTSTFGDVLNMGPSYRTFKSRSVLREERRKRRRKGRVRGPMRF